MITIVTSLFFSMMFGEYQRQPDGILMELVYHLIYLFNKYLLIPDMVNGVSQSKIRLLAVVIPLVLRFKFP